MILIFRYGFHKVVAVDSGGLKSERVEDMEFAHQFFLRGHEHLLENIKRKAAKKEVRGSIILALRLESF